MENMRENYLPRWQPEARIELYQEALSVMRDCVRSLNTCVLVASTGLESEKAKFEKSGASPFVDSKLAGIECDIDSCLRKNLSKIYELLTQTFRFSHDDSEYKPGREQLLGDGSVEVHLEPEGVFIKLPMLALRSARYPKLKENRHVAELLRFDIVYAIEHAAGYESYDFRRFSCKILQFLYVYNVTQRNKNIAIADNDNHETKLVQDAIVLFTPGGDHGLSCSNYSKTVMTDDLPQGTYITLVEEKNGIMSAEKIIDKWAEHLKKPASTP